MHLTVNGLMRAFTKALVAFVLLLSALTPAVAEVGCFEEARVHESAQVSQTAEVLTAIGSDADGGSGAGKASHCAFSHCCQAVPLKTAGRNLGAGDLGASLYSIAADDRLVPALQDGPYHPPQA